MSEDSISFFMITKINIAEKKIDDVIRCGVCCHPSNGERPAFCPGWLVV